jgi:hypothetical protein
MSKPWQKTLKKQKQTNDKKNGENNKKT